MNVEFGKLISRIQQAASPTERQGMSSECPVLEVELIFFLQISWKPRVRSTRSPATSWVSVGLELALFSGTDFNQELLKFT